MGKHFNELLKIPTHSELPIIAETNNEREISIEPPEMQYILSAIKSLRNGKSNGNDHMNADLFQIDSDEPAILIYNIFKDTWNKQIYRTSWMITL